MLRQYVGCPLSNDGIGSEIDIPALAAAIDPRQLIAHPIEQYTGTILNSAEVGAQWCRLQVV